MDSGGAYAHSRGYHSLTHPLYQNIRLNEQGNFADKGKIPGNCCKVVLASFPNVKTAFQFIEITFAG